ncbi:MAG: protein-export chaperone SecB [Alphaproteobacteria bacterium]
MADDKVAVDTGNTATDTQTPKAAVKPIQILAQYLKDISFENPGMLRPAPDNGRGPDINLSINVGHQHLQDAVFEVVLSLRAEATRDQKPVFLAEIAYAGVFVFSNLTAEQLREAIFIEAPRLLFPFARGIMSDVTREGGYQPLLLQPIDFVELYVSSLRAQSGSENTQAPEVKNAN